MDGVSWRQSRNLLKLGAGRDQAQNGLDLGGYSFINLQFFINNHNESAGIAVVHQSVM